MNIIIGSVALSDPERARLRAIFSCADDAALEAKLGEIGRAALQEHLDMFLGAGAFTRGSDFREHRLAMLVLHAFGAKIPNEAVVSRMFQSTRSGSRALLRAMLSKYQIRLEDAVKATLAGLIGSAKPYGNVIHRFTCDSPALVDQLNQLLAGMPDAYAPISPLVDQAGRYSVANSALAALKTELGI